jgi:G3E family GTPase
VQQLEHLVERRRVRAAGGTDREEPAQISGDTARLVALVEGAGTLPPRRFAARNGLGGARPEHAHHHFASLELPLPAELERAHLLAFLTALPPEVLRVKGVAVLRGPAPEVVLFQKVEGSDPPVLLSLGEATQVERVAIFIGPRLPVDTIHQLAAAHLPRTAATR